MGAGPLELDNTPEAVAASYISVGVSHITFTPITLIGPLMSLVGESMRQSSLVKHCQKILKPMRPF